MSYNFSDLQHLISFGDHIKLKGSSSNYVQQVTIQEIDVVENKATVNWTESGEVTRTKRVKFAKIFKDNYDLYRTQFVSKGFGDQKKYDNHMIRYLNTQPVEKEPSIPLKAAKDRNIYFAKTGPSTKCPICRENFKFRQAASTRCGHIFCYECLMKQKQTSFDPVCAVCKSSIGKIMKLYF